MFIQHWQALIIGLKGSSCNIDLDVFDLKLKAVCT